MSKLWIKICGITRAEDARALSDLGADALGVVFYPPSPRAMILERLADVLEPVSDTVDRVALFVDPVRSLVERVCATGLIDKLQFHGAESADFCESFSLPYIKAIRVGADEDILATAAAYDSADMLLLDSFDKVVPGGTGKVFDWDLAEALVNEKRHRVVVAGGLTPENVSEAVGRLHPYGVDVSSGVESAPGIKCKDKMKAFIEGARNG